MALSAGGTQRRIRGTGVGIEGRKLLKVLERNVDLRICKAKARAGLFTQLFLFSLRGVWRAWRTHNYQSVSAFLYSHPASRRLKQ